MRQALKYLNFGTITRDQVESIRRTIVELEEQFEASREATQEWYDEAHAQRTAINRALHELDQWVYADGTAAYRVERAEAILREASNPASRSTDE